MLLSREVGLDPTDPEYYDKFIELSNVFRELTDRLGRLPHKNEFLAAWQSWLMFKEMEETGIGQGKPHMEGIGELSTPIEFEAA